MLPRVVSLERREGDPKRWFTVLFTALGSLGGNWSPAAILLCRTVRARLDSEGLKNDYCSQPTPVVHILSILLRLVLYSFLLEYICIYNGYC
jgi:hypothetical protein